MPPKQRTNAPSAAAHTSTPTKAPGNGASKSTNPQDASQILQSIWSKYLQQTPQRTKLLDAFMAFLIVVGVLQFVYCVIAGNFVRLSSSPSILPFPS
jgi:oligosaccharyltransferase complex subunit epsilon